MGLGLKHGTIELQNHTPEWEKIAAETIKCLWGILGDTAVDIQHIGSTAITSIKAKPIIDIAVAVNNFDDVMALAHILGGNGFIYRKQENHLEKSLLFACGNYSDSEGKVTHFIHVVKADGIEYVNYLNFRNYMNAHNNEAKRYEELKVQLMNENPVGSGREKYTTGKQEFVTKRLLFARIWEDLGRRFTKIAPINKGWSCDKKYCVTIKDGTKYLLRITPFEKSQSRKALFEILQRVSALDIPICKPVEFGTCDEGVYMLHTWIDGEDAEDIIPLLTETEQYVLGLRAGEILKEIHSIPAPDTQEEWCGRFKRKTNTKMQKYRECGLHFDGDEKIIEYIENSHQILENRPQTFQHGDYHIGNMMIQNGELIIIDFDRFDFGDPWEEFNRIVWCAQATPYFATGMVDGYFNKKPPMPFWQLLAYYISSNTLSSIYWAIPFGQGEIDTMMKQSQDVLMWYNNMQSVVPTWYIKNFYIQYTDGVPYKMKLPYDFSFLEKYGRVFKVFDDQDSGNICFGVKNATGDKYFVKFAGAPTERSNISAEEAIQNLKRTVPTYRNLAHPSLIKLVSSEEIGGGFAMIFQWVEAECMGRMYPLSRQKVMSMSLEVKKCVFEEVLLFHSHVAKQNYVAIDFYDGSVMYDFINERTIICDIDLYAHLPYVNEMGRMWDSSRFMSPEEFQLGAVIDEVTNVYTMGAFAFALFADGNRTEGNWPLSPKLFTVAKRAISDKRSERQQSIEELIEEWRLTI